MADPKTLDDGLFVVPRGRPPVAQSSTRRGSLPNIHRAVKSARNAGRPTLLKAKESGSYGNLLSRKPRSSSNLALGAAKLSTKALSASNLAALSDPNLSLREAIPAKSYDVLNTNPNLSKKLLEQLIKRYYYQLTEGCQSEGCLNQFCKSSPNCIQVSDSSAALVAIELVTQNKPYLCLKEKFVGRPLPKQIFVPENGNPQQFLHAMLLTSPFKSLFEESVPITESKSEPMSFCGETRNDTLQTQADKSLRASFGSLLPSEIWRTKSKQSVLGFNTNSMTNLTMQHKESNLGFSMSKLSDSVDYLLRTNSSTDLAMVTSTPVTTPLNLSISFSNSSLDSTTTSPHLSPMAVCGNDDMAVSQLEEYEAQLAMEIAVGDVQEFSLTHLTLDNLKTGIDNMKQTQDTSFLLNTLRTVLTSPEALSQSFKIDESEASTADNLDTLSSREAFDLLTNLSPYDDFNTVLMNSIDILLLTLSKKPLNKKEINIVLILFECPLFRKRRHHSLRQKLCHIIASLSMDVKILLTEVLSKYNCDVFEKRLMGIYRDHFMLMLKPNQRSDPSMIDVAQTLEVFFCANIQCFNSTGQHLVPLKLFYINELSRKLNFKEEFDLWKSQMSGRSSATSSDSSCQLSILSYPFLLDPSSKVQLLHLDAIMAMRQEYQEAILNQAKINQIQKYFKSVDRTLDLADSIKSAMCPFLVLEVRRDHIVQDTLNQIRLKHVDIRKPLKIKYVGGGEQGLDMGGLQKEFFQLICEKVFDPDYGMFLYKQETHTIWFNGSSVDCLEEFELIGTILGLAIYNGIILDVHFPQALYKKLQNELPDLVDLMDYQPTVGKGLQDLHDYTHDDVEDVFCLNFQISEERLGELHTVDLMANGEYIPVNNQNRGQYVQSYVDYILTQSIRAQFEAFKRGFVKVCNSEVLSLFRPDELELLVCGSPDLDFVALEKSATYDDGYHLTHPTVRAFWTIAHNMLHDHKKQLLHFITGSDRVPLKGLAHLPIIIQRNGGDVDRLPTAMTCFNRLLLPAYSSKEKLKQQLITAIENGKGFGLT